MLQCAQIEVRVCVVRPQRDRLEIRRTGRIVLAQALKHVAEIMVNFGVGGLDFDGASQQFDGSSAASLLIGDHAEHMQGVGLRR